jgi:hypothetical protein
MNIDQLLWYLFNLERKKAFTPLTPIGYMPRKPSDEELLEELKATLKAFEAFKARMNDPADPTRHLREEITELEKEYQEPFKE